MTKTGSPIKHTPDDTGRLERSPVASMGRHSPRQQALLGRHAASCARQLPGVFLSCFSAFVVSTFVSYCTEDINRIPITKRGPTRQRTVTNSLHNLHIRHSSSVRNMSKDTYYIDDFIHICSLKRHIT